MWGDSVLAHGSIRMAASRGGGLQDCTHGPCTRHRLGLIFSFPPGFANTLKRWLIIFRKLNNFYGQRLYLEHKETNK